MKKIIFSLMVLCATLLVSCGNSEVEKIKQLVVDATEQTMAAESAEEVAQIAMGLQAAMEEIAAESGNKLTIGKGVESELLQYQEAAQAKLAEFGLEME